MDDLLDQMLSLPSWSEIGGNTRAPWDFNGGRQANSVSADTGSGPSSHQKFTRSLMPAGISSSSSGIQGLTVENHEMQDNIHQSRIDEDTQYPFEDQLMSTQPHQQQGLQDALVESAVSPTAVPSQIDIRIQTLPQVSQDAAQNTMQQITDSVANTRPVALQLNLGNSMVLNTPTSQVLAAAASLLQGAPGLIRSPSAGSSGSEGSGSQQPQFDSQSPSLVTPSWCQPYMRGVLPLPVGVGQANAESFLSLESMPDDVHLFGPASQQSHQQIQAGQGVSILPYGSHTGFSQSQGAAAVSSGTTRPRVRARRGQATDPHSIAERLRRERIADRMKALQELVPNSNKTDKASMLDEIIEYVKFLQLQVKVLSMSRLGGAGAVAPLVAELPTEGHSNSSASILGHNSGVSIPAQDGMAAAERQVAKLMEEDMGSAMQYLQGKGLCLMPISLATVISSSSPRQRTNNQCGMQSLTAYGEHSRLEASSIITVTSSSNTMGSGVVVSPVNTSGDVVCIDSVALGGNMILNSKDSIQVAAVDKNLLPSATNSGAKWNEVSTGQGQ